jgi:mRNA-degrading endonuclease YafQ of YafQ-DinJ toxin-antitoxin module
VSYTLFYTQRYNKLVAKFLKKHPNLINQYSKTLELLTLNPFHPLLRLHPLKGKLKDLYSISINLSYRITLELLVEGKHIILVNVGDHGEVY